MLPYSWVVVRGLYGHHTMHALDITSTITVFCATLVRMQILPSIPNAIASEAAGCSARPCGRSRQCAGGLTVTILRACSLAYASLPP